MSDVPQSLQIGREERRKVLDRCFQQIRQWGVALPRTDPLVMDFGLGEFERFGLCEFWIANEAEAGYCGKYMFVFDGQTCPRHYHRVKHETFFVVHGKLEVTLDDQSLLLEEGETLAIAPNHSHSFAGAGPALMLELSMPCDPQDNFFERAETNEWLRLNVGTPIGNP